MALWRCSVLYQVTKRNTHWRAASRLANGFFGYAGVYFKVRNKGSEFIGDIETFRKVFQSRTGITISTIHGVKGAEFDAVIAYALLEDMVPHFNDPNGQESALKLLYVIGLRARKNLHLISERGRIRQYSGEEYQATRQLVSCKFSYDQD